MWGHARLHVHREIRQMLALQLDKWGLVKLGKVRAFFNRMSHTIVARHYA